MMHPVWKDRLVHLTVFWSGKINQSQ